MLTKLKSLLKATICAFPVALMVTTANAAVILALAAQFSRTTLTTVKVCSELPNQARSS